MKNFKTIKKIGEGQFSEIYLVENNRKKKFVLKKFKKGFKQEARREFLYLNVFNDSHIVKALKYYEEEPPALLLEYLSGNVMHPSLFENKKAVFSFLSKLSKTITKIHSAGICLNDLKPDNIIIQKNEAAVLQPNIVDFGLATLNLYNDRNLRGTISYIAPEKLSRQTNHFPADIFSLGIVYLYLTNGKTPADEFQFEEYKRTLLSQELWSGYINNLKISKFIKNMLAFSPLERPDAHEVVEYFSELSNEKLPELSTFEIKNYIFPAQIDAVKKLWKMRKLNCDSLDEPEKIVNLASLWSESEDRKLVILNETDFVWHPEHFFTSLSSYFNKEIKSHNDLANLIKDNDEVNILLKRSNKVPSTTFFDELVKTENILVLTEKDKSDISNISKKELNNFIQKIHINESNRKHFVNNYNPTKPYLVRLMLTGLIAKEDEKLRFDKGNELIQFLAYLTFPVPFLLIEKVWNNWQKLLQPALQYNKIIIEGESLRFIGKYQKSISLPQEMINKATDQAIKLNLFLIAGKIAFLQKNTKLALEYWEKHIQSLIQQEYYFSAYESFKWLYDCFTENELTYRLRKMEAFLTRICGYPKKALNLYNKIAKNLDDLNLAILSADKAIALQELGQYDDAIEVYEKAGEIFKNNNKTKAFLRTRNNLGVTLIDLKRYREAKNVYNNLLKLAEQHNDIQFITMSYLNLADLSLRMGEWKKSLHFAQKASELAKKHNKFNIQIWADLIAIQANFALGNNESLPKVINKIRSLEKIKENKQLYIEILSKFLYISQFIDKKNANEIANELLNETKIHQNEEANREIFFYLYHKKRFLEMIDVYDKLEGKEILKSLLESDVGKILRLLREFVSSDDILTCLYFASHIIISKSFNDKESLINEIKNLSKINPFHPLEELLKEEQKTSVPEQLPIYWEILNLIHSNVEFTKTMEAVLIGILKIGKLERALFFDYKQNKLQPVIGLDKNIHPLPLDNILVSRTILRDTIKLGQIRFLSNLQEDIPFDIHSSIFGLGLRTAICFPLIINNETKGVIYSDARGDKTFSDNEKRILEAILIQAHSALEKSDLYENLKKESELLQSSIPNTGYSEIIGNCKKMQEVFALMRMVAGHNVNVLITGPTGSGKELVARALHHEYAKKSPFVVVNCAAIPEQLLESELFGYTKGAFTGAITDRKGKIELANDGTLFLDEISDMPLSLQAKLLRVIQERIVTPIGSIKEIPVSIRIIAATNQDLEKLVKEKKFREDLLYRIKVITIKLPALNERIIDIPLLIHHFIEKFNIKFKKNIKSISAEALKYLQSKEWKGNVRELENEIERAVLLCRKDIVDMEYFGEVEDKSKFSIIDNLPEKWKDYQTYKKRINATLDVNYAKKLLKKTKGNIQMAGQMGGLDRKQIYRLLQKDTGTDKTQ